MLKVKEKKFKPHRGQIAKAAIESSGYTYKHVAEKLEKDYSTLYRWFDDENLAVDKMINIGRVIKHDFSGDIPEISSIVAEEPADYGTNTLKDCIQQRDRWLMKYTELLEKYNRLIEGGKG